MLLPQERAVIYFITCCTHSRQKCLDSQQAHEAILTAWQRLPNWLVGRYTIMPDHLHFFALPFSREANLSNFMQAFRALVTRQLRPANFPYPLWQREFFDHILRSGENYEEKWNYVWLNPVRHQLVAEPGDWPYSGEINRLAL